MKLKLGEIGGIVSGEVFGDKDKIITGVNGLAQACGDEISFLSNMKYLSVALDTKAGAIFISNDMQDQKFEGKNIVRVKDPQYAYALMLNIIAKEKIGAIKLEISPNAYISQKAKIGKNVYIGQAAVIEGGASIGDGTRIFPNVYIGQNVKIGQNCIIYPNVVIREDVILGDRVIIQPNAVIGGDGFGFATIDGKNQKIPQIGRVEIGNDVEIGANTTVDRATVDATRIGDGTKIDNLVQIAHNVQIGQNCLIVAQVGISGSTKLGNNVTIGGQTGIVGHLEIGNNVLIASQAGISGNLKDGERIGGNPMSELSQSIKVRATMRKLPEMYQDLRKIKKQLEEK